MKPAVIRTLVFAFATTALSTASSCVSVWHFEDLEKRVAVLEKTGEEIAARQKSDQERLEKLHADMMEAEETLRSNGANLSDDMEALKLEAAKLRSSDEELRYGIAKQSSDLNAIKRALDERLGVSSLDIPEGLVNDPEKLIQTAEESFKNGDDRKASELAEIATNKYPDSLVAARGHFLLGEIAFKAGNWATAVREFQRVHDRFKSIKGAPVNEALLKIAETLDKQGNCKKSIAVLEYLAESAKKTPEAATAEKKIKELKKRKNCR